MRRNIPFIAIIILLFFHSTLMALDDPDTCEVLSIDSVSAYSHTEVRVRIFSDEELGGFIIGLTFQGAPLTYFTCDSIHWSDWFWDNPADNYSGGLGQENYIDSAEQKLNIGAIWFSPPYLSSKDTTIANIHFTIGEISLIQPDGEEVWSVGDGRLIKWSPRCAWNGDDTLVIDSLRWQSGPQGEGAIQFSDPFGGVPDVEFVSGYLVRAPQNLDSVMIEYSSDAGKSWNIVTSSTPNDSEYLWSPIPDTPSDSCLIRITSKAENPISVISDGFFTIKAETTGVREEKKLENLPEKFVLYQNYPNPFNPSTKIEFFLSERAQVRLEIYDIRGRRVKKLLDQELSSGHWSIVWDGEDDKGAKVASGVYFYRLIASQYTQTRKMVIIK